MGSSESGEYSDAVEELEQLFAFGMSCLEVGAEDSLEGGKRHDQAAACKITAFMAAKQSIVGTTPFVQPPSMISADTYCEH